MFCYFLFFVSMKLIIFLQWMKFFMQKLPLQSYLQQQSKFSTISCLETEKISFVFLLPFPLIIIEKSDSIDFTNNDDLFVCLFVEFFLQKLKRWKIVRAEKSGELYYLDFGAQHQGCHIAIFKNSLPLWPFGLFCPFWIHKNLLHFKDNFFWQILHHLVCDSIFFCILPIFLFFKFGLYETISSQIWPLKF